MIIASQDIDEIYQENLKFWDGAWKRVSKPHKELPKLPYIHEITRKLKKYQVKKVLDLGCGSGWLSIFISKYGFEVTGIDIAKPAIELGKTWAQEENITTVNFLVGDVFSLSFKENSFDAVICNSVLEHFRFDQAEKIFEKIHKVLNDKGFLFGCFDHVGTGKGEYYELGDSTHIYTDQMRKGMMLRNYTNEELKTLLKEFDILSFDKNNYGSRLVWAKKKL